MNKKRILSIISSSNLNGGTPQKLMQLIQQSKHEHYVFFYNTPAYMNDGKEYLKLFSKYAICINGADFSLMKTILFLNSFIKKNKIEIVHSYFTYGIFLGFLLKVFNSNLKMICSFVGPHKEKSYKKILLNISLLRYDLVVFISQYVKNEKLKHLSFLKNNKNIILYNGADIRKDSGTFDFIPSNKIRMVCVGGFSNWKNQIILIEALNILVNKMMRKDLILNLVGNGELFELIKEKVRQYQLEEYVVMKGYSSDVGSAFKNADILLHPAYEEGFGIAVAEGLLYGLPAILSNAGALPELITDGIEGFLVSYNNANEWCDKILYLCTHHEEMLRMGLSAKENAKQRFSSKIFVKNSDQIYDSL